MLLAEHYESLPETELYESPFETELCESLWPWQNNRVNPLLKDVREYYTYIYMEHLQQLVTDFQNLEGLGASWGHLMSILGRSRDHLVSILEHLGISWAHLGSILGPLAASWEALRASWKRLLRLLGSLGVHF